MKTVNTIELEYWIGDEVTTINGTEVMVVVEVSIAKDRIQYGCIRPTGETAWYIGSYLNGFKEKKEIGFIKKQYEE